MGMKDILENPYARAVLPAIVTEACVLASLATLLLGFPATLFAFAGCVPYIVWRIEYNPKPDKKKVVDREKKALLGAACFRSTGARCLGKVDPPVWAIQVNIWGSILNFSGSFTKEKAVEMSLHLSNSVSRNLAFDGSSQPEFHLYEDYSDGTRKIISSTRLPCFSCVRNDDDGSFCASVEPVNAYAVFSENGYIDIPSSMATVSKSH